MRVLVRVVLVLHARYDVILPPWGIDENYIRAQAEIESGWHQDCAAANKGTGCHEGGGLNNPNRCTPTSITGGVVTPITPNGTFCDLHGLGGVAATSQYDSWSKGVLRMVHMADDRGVYAIRPRLSLR